MRLKTLGGLLLESDGGRATGAASQRRRLALLALLARAGDRGLSRDKLIGYLWPESEPDKARRVLAQGLYAIRRDLGGDVLVLGTNEVRLNTAVLPTDAEEFETALESGRLEDAVALYDGPFLDGFYLNDAPEFERWIEGERSALAHRFATALECLAVQATSRGDHLAAVGWWRRLAAVDPLNARVTTGLMRALVAAGDRGGALQHARVYETLLRQELDLDPDRAVVALAEQLRHEPAPTPAPPPRHVIADPGPAAAPRTIVPTAATAAASWTSDGGGTAVLAAPSDFPLEPFRGAPLPTLDPSPAPAEPLIGRIRMSTIAVGLAAISVLLIVALLFLPERPAPTAGDTVHQVAVLPFTVRGDSEYDYLGEGMVDLLSTSFNGAGAYTSVDPHSVLGAVGQLPAGTGPRRGDQLAAQLGAGMFVLGDVMEIGGKLRLSASLYRAGELRAPVSHGVVEGAPDSLMPLVDQLARQLLTPSGEEPESRLVHLAAVTTSSLPALKAYLEGERQFRAFRLVPAIEAFQRAIALDSTFALAWYRVGSAAVWTLNGRLARQAAERVAVLAGRLSPRDRLIFTAFRSYIHGAADEAELRYRSVVSPYPDDVEGWLGLGEVLFHHNWSRGRSVGESRQAWQQALTLDPTNWQAILHLQQVAALEQRGVERDSLYELLTRTVPDGVVPVFWAAQQAWSTADTTAQQQVLAALRESNSYYITLAVWYVSVYAHDLDGAATIARLLTREGTVASARGFGHIVLAYLSVARGRLADAERELAAAEAFLPVDAAEARANLLLIPFVPATPAQLRAARERLVPPAPDTLLPLYEPRGFATVHEGQHAVIQAYLRAGLDIRLGDFAPARSQMARLEAAAANTAATPEVRELARGLARDLAIGLRAQIAWARGRDSVALEELERMRLEAPFELAWASPFYARIHERWLRAELLERTGRAGDAADWYRTFAENAPYDLVYLAPALLHAAEIHEQRGETALAIRGYQRMIELWRDCDPELRPLVAKAERRLARLGPRAAAS